MADDRIARCVAHAAASTMDVEDFGVDDGNEIIRRLAEFGYQITPLAGAGFRPAPAMPN